MTLADALIAVGFVLSVWWLATGLVLMLVRRAGNRKNAVVAGASVLALASLYGLYASAQLDSVTGVYIAFLSALGLWAWNETTFLIGAITGPSRSECPTEAVGFQRFTAAFAVVRDHEFGIVASAIAVAVVTWDAPNLFGLWVFLLLWAMRTSAKLNIFMGAPKAISALLPEHLAYLNSYFNTSRTSPLFPISFLAASAGFAALCYQAVHAPSTADGIGFVLLATFLALALVEHLFLITPIQDSALWSWALPSKERDDRNLKRTAQKFTLKETSP